MQDKHNELAGAERRVEKVQERIDEAKVSMLLEAGKHASGADVAQARVDETSDQITKLEARHNEAQEASDRLWKEREAFSSELREKRKVMLDLRVRRVQTHCFVNYTHSNALGSGRATNAKSTSRSRIATEI